MAFLMTMASRPWYVVVADTARHGHLPVSTAPLAPYTELHATLTASWRPSKTLARDVPCPGSCIERFVFCELEVALDLGLGLVALGHQLFQYERQDAALCRRKVRDHLR